MKILVLLAIMVAIAGPVCGQGSENPALVEVCQSFNRLNSMIRDGRIAIAAARPQVMETLDKIRLQYLQGGADRSPESRWIFPVAGYDRRAIGGGEKGYQPRGYDYFSGNRHGGHPAFDIFIRDRNQDSRDDRTGTPVAVLSMTGGVVVAAEQKWEPGSGLRGGRYLWVYEPDNNLLIYYAHNDELKVAVGDVVQPGEVIATMGRTGLNAAKRRSPTHLHLSVLKVGERGPVPLNVYRQLTVARTLSPR